MVFGSKVSVTAWEPFRRAIKVMTKVFSPRSDLIKKHQAYLDMVIIGPAVAEGTTFTKTVKCQLNTGILGKNESQKPTHNYIYMGDCLLACICTYTLRLLTAYIEVIFVVLGDPGTSLH